MSRRRRPQQKRPTPLLPAPLQFEEKVNPAFSQVVMFGDIPQAHMMPKNYRTYALEGYRANDTIFKCIQYITTNAAAIPPKLYTDDTMEKEIEKHPLLDKLKRPNPEQSGVAYRRAILGHYLVAGNSFQYAIRKGKAGPPDELWTLEPYKVKILPSRTRGIVGYNYDDFENTTPPQNPIDAANIAHLKTWAPDDPLWGVSPIEVGALQVDQQMAAKKWNLALLQNSAKMSGAFTTDVILSPNDRSKVEDKLNEKIAGFRNAGRVPVLDGGLKWMQMSVPPQQMDWLEALKYNAGSLANLFNMPPQLIGDTSSTTYDNMEQAKAASYTEEIFPILDDLYALWTMWLLPMYPDLQNAYLYYDKETVEVVQTVIQAKNTAIAERATAAWTSGQITMNEARKLQDLPEVPGGDVFNFGAVLVRVEDLDTYAEQALQKPAAPPALVPENILDNPPPTQPGQAPAPAQKPQQPQPANTQDEKPPANNDAPKKSRKAAQEVTHLLWQCAPGACEFCLENDGEVVAEGEDFPNGCTGPDDCHRFCKCEAIELSIPDDIQLAGIDASNFSSFGAALAALYAVGRIASRHDRDVAEQHQQDQDEEEEKRRQRIEYKRLMEVLS